MSTETNPPQSNVANNRQLQELMVLRGARNRPNYQAGDVPTYIRDIPDGKVEEYIQIYRRNLQSLEQQLSN